MARYEARFVYQTDGGWVSFEKSFKHMRDRVRAGLAGSTAVVSDIGQWAGFTGAIGYAFIIKDGPDEWMIVSGTGMTGGNIIGNRNITTRNLFLRVASGGNVTASSSGDNFNIIYNCRKGSFQFGFNDAVNCTYTAGDFQTPLFSPFSQLEQFIPAGILRGLTLTTPTAGGLTDIHTLNFQIVYDDVHKTVLLLLGYQGMVSPSLFYLAGQPLTLLQTGDNDAAFQGWIDLTWNNTNAGTHPANTGIAQVYDSSGATHDCRYVYTNPFTLANYILPDDTIDYIAVKIASSTYSKGYLHTDLVRVQGAANTGVSYGSVFDGPAGPLVKYTADFALMYKEGIPIFPYDIQYDVRNL